MAKKNVILSAFKLGFYEYIHPDISAVAFILLIFCPSDRFDLNTPV